MKIAVIYKWARDPEAAAVRSDGSVDWRGAKMTAGEDDPAALDAAKSLAADAGAELVGITAGDGDASWALARGVQTAYSITDLPALTDQSRTGQVLAAAVRQIGDVDVVAVGDAQQYSGVPVALAGALGWPVLLGLTSAAVAGDQIVATRRAGSGQARLTVSAPVVLGFAAEAEEKKAPGMKELLMARKRPVSKLAMADLGLDATERVISQGTRVPEEKQARVFQGEPAQTAKQLVDALRAEGVL